MRLEQHELIQILRRRADMNQGTLGAKAFNTTYESGRTKIKNLELGKQAPTQQDLERLARVLAVSPADLMADTNGDAAQTVTAEDGFRIHPQTLERFPQLGPYLDMLNKAVALDDGELMEYIGEKIASILQVAADQKGNRAASR